MANNQQNKNENPLVSWILTIIMLTVFWPVGIFMLIRMLTVGSVTSPRKDGAAGQAAQTSSQSARRPSQKANGPIDVTAREVHDIPTRATPQPRASETKTAPPPQPHTVPPTPDKGPSVADTTRAKRKKKANPIPKGKGGWLITIGILLEVFGGIAVTQGIIELFTSSYFVQPLAFGSGAVATGLVLLGVGFGRRRKNRRFRKYLTLVGQNESLSIDSLAKAMPVSYNKACAELQEMLDEGYLPAGYVDYANRRLILSESGMKDAPKPSRPEPQPAPVSAVKDDDAILSAIQAINDDIDDEEMSRKITRVQEITAKILAYQKDNPSSDGELRSFLDYYLPTTLKLLRSYAKLEDQGIVGENISASKARIEGMMDKIVDGFEKRLDKLFQTDALDITSDVAVLEQMLQKDGLAETIKIEL